MTDKSRAGASLGYSGQTYWDEYHGEAHKPGIIGGVKLEVWLECFTPLLRSAGVESLLDLGCGSGRDAVELAAEGYRVAGCDISPVAIERARALVQERGLKADFLAHDIATSLPYDNDAFEAVICNLTLHMFSTDVARDIVAEVRRCLAPGGLFLFHVNSTEDLPYRRELQPPVVEVGNGMYCLGQGQTMRFFSESDCRDLLSDWQLLNLEPVCMLRPDGAVQKCAWRCAAVVV